jgi:RsiW-degrading membrane proteinase PrsW (M82 family)
MNGIALLLTLILLAALPIILAYLWLRIRKYQFNMIWFLCLLLAGVISVAIALVLQGIMPSITVETVTDLCISIIIRTAIPEEASKCIALFLFIALAKRWKRLHPIETKSDGAAAGLILALGFALFETAGYAMSNLELTLLRAVTASPIHAACGIRIGMSAVSFKTHHISSGIMNMIAAVLIHTAYNFVIFNPDTPLIFVILIVSASLLSSLMHIPMENTKEETANINTK